MLNPDLLSEVNFCRLCGFVFTDKRRKKIMVSLRKCLKVFGVKVLEGDKRAVCVTRVGIELRNRGRVGCLYRYFCSH